MDLDDAKEHETEAENCVEQIHGKWISHVWVLEPAQEVSFWILWSEVLRWCCCRDRFLSKHEKSISKRIGEVRIIWVAESTTIRSKNKQSILYMAADFIQMCLRIAETWIIVVTNRASLRRKPLERTSFSNHLSYQISGVLTVLSPAR